MRMSQMLGLRFKEAPADCQIESHILMMRGGYIKNVGSGIFSLFTPGRRITQKIEAIIREEMNRIDGQEVLLPVSMPAALWKESGRFESVGSELLRFKDRGGNDMVLGMTHEEAVVHLARNTAQSYTDFPFMVYQIQTKFRDEPRARGGLIRVREFTMKDAYSFHTSQEDLEAYYQRCYEAYERIFARCGIPETISVKSDSGMMGGKIAHEFMLLAEVGEDSLVICDSCDFRSNMEVAACVIHNEAGEDSVLEQIETPKTKTIDELCSLLHIKPSQTCKAVIYRKNSDDALVIVFLRGDLEVNETKLRNFLREEIHPDVTEDTSDAVVYGFVGPVGLAAPDATVLFDASLKGCHGLACGANKSGFHYTGFTPGRDLPDTTVYADFAKTYEGAICPVCGQKTIRVRKGIEVGNIFQLGTKYTESMGMQYTAKDGEQRYPIMGCYGIGVGRLAASVCEVRRDSYGPIWPMSIAPWQIHICALRYDNQTVLETSNSLYDSLVREGLEVLFDDRITSAGIMFSDADLLGIPIRATVSPKTCSRGVIEVSARDKAFTVDIPMAEAAGFLKDKISEMLGAYRPES